MKMFDGRKTRDEILAEVKTKISKMEQRPGLAVICVGDNPVCSKYVSLKKKVADQLDVDFINFSFDIHNTQDEIIAKIKELNLDQKIDGIMIQMPVPENFDKFELVHAISAEKDVDGLRFCCSFKSKFKPPVVLAIMKAIEDSLVCHSGLDPESSLDSRFRGNDKINKPEDDKNLSDCLKDKEVVVVGRGFLVGWPLAQCLEEAMTGVIVADSTTKNLEEITKTADILISAVGKHDIIKPEMIKAGVVLIDAGSSEEDNAISGNFAHECYTKASFYTPVPGGIGPLTVAMIFQNLLSS